MKKIILSIIAICLLINSFGVIGFAKEATVETYTIEGSFESAKEGDTITVFILKDGVTMESLKNVSGPVMDKLYLVNDFPAGADGNFSFDITVSSEALDCQCVLICNKVSIQDTLRNFIKGEKIQLVYAAPYGKSSGDGTFENPCNLSTALSKANAFAKEGYNVDICLLGGEYDLTSSRLQLIDINTTNPDTRITYRPATENDKVVFSGMKRIPSENFTKVTDNSILSRIPENARTSVYSIDLVAAGIDASQLSFNYAGETASIRSINPPTLYLNGKRQRISQYPNEDYFTTGRNSTGTNSNGNPQLNVSALSDIDVSKWVASKDNAYLTGFLFESYRASAAKLLDIDTTTKKLTIDGTTPFYYETDGDLLIGYKYFGPRVTIVNLPEEMDIPGEWCIDQATNIMYYYAPYEITENDVFEMPVKSSTYPQLAFIQNSNNITFKNIEFKGTRNHIGIYVSNADGIQFIDCDIHAIAKTGISASGTKNTLVDGCNVYDVGAAGISVAGNIAIRDDVSVESNNVVSNNHIYNFSQNPTLGSDGQGITINRISSNSKSLGDTIENNVIHGSKFIGAVRYSGLDTNIKRNEMYNLLDSVDDAGVVYSGRTFNEFGNTISENYIHDYSVINNARYSNMGIYWDDHISGQTAERNIIAGPYKSDVLGIRTIGYANVIKNNIFVDSYYAMRLGDRGTVDFAKNDTHNLYSSLSELPNEAYDYYDDMVAFKTVLDNNNKQMVYKATTEKNLTVNSKYPVYYSSAYYNQAETEIENVIADANVFADGSYIVKAENATEGTAFAEVPNENNFSMDLIGTQKEVPFANHEFNLLYPADNAEISKDNVVLTWEEATFSDRYDYVIAKDAGFTRIAEQGSTKNNFVIPATDLTDGKYYWKVTAVNTSADMGREWICKNTVSSFTVGEGMSVEIIENKVKSGETVIKALKGVSNFDVDYAIYNKADETKSFVAVAALFDSDDRLKNVAISETADSVATGCTKSGTLKFYSDSAISEDGYYVKVFILENLGSIVPLSYSEELLK